MSNHKYVVSSTPHIRSSEAIDKIMKDVTLALLPATAFGVYFFGLRALIVVAISIASCILFEYLFQKVAKRDTTINDFSAVVTGLLLALNLPSSVPFWLPVIGAFIAIILVKQIFGGLGQNFMNPALAARAFLLASYPTAMTDWTVDSVSTATPLELVKTGELIPQTTDYMNALIGTIGGCIGETSALAILLGGIYLLYRKVISWRIPVTFISTTVVLSFVFGREGIFTGAFPLYEVLLGGVLLGAFFMATDYSSSPITPKGQLWMGIGCGILTVLIRVYGGYPEGVSYSILIMNLCVPLIDRFTKPTVFGVQKEVKGNA